MADRISRRTSLARIGAGVLALVSLPAALGTGSDFGHLDAEDHIVVDTGAGLGFGVRKSDGAIAWARHLGRKVRHQNDLGFSDGALVTARRAGDHVIVRACATDRSGVTTYRYLVARKNHAAIYAAIHTDDQRPDPRPRALLLGHGTVPDPSFMYGLGLLGLTAPMAA